MEVAIAAPGDEPALAAFLAARVATSMFLLTNLTHGGLAYAGRRRQAQFAVAWDGGAVVGAVAHAWNGMLQLQGGPDAVALARAVVAHSQRPVSGLIGPLAQVRAARHALGLDAAPATLDADEALMEVALDRLVAPVAGAGVAGRRALPAELDRLVAWKLAYDLEASGIAPTPARGEVVRAGLAEDVADGVLWVAARADGPVAMSLIGARVPACVQINGVYTPPAERNRGFARVAVAASLVDARATGVGRAVLFTKDPAAIASYRGLGFAELDRFGLVLLRQPSNAVA